MNDSIHIRRLSTEDTRLAQNTIRRVKQQDQLLKETAQQNLDMTAWLENERNILIVASDEDVPVGFALGYLLDRVDTKHQMLFFYEIEVVATHRRRGIGRALVHAMRSVAREQQVVKMWVQTAPDNLAARQLYECADGMEKAQPDLLISWSRGDNL